MKHKYFFGLVFLCLNSCIPLKIAPNIDDYRIAQGSRFSNDLPEREMFLFEDPKEAGEFYTYINTKFQLNNERVTDDVPFTIEGKQFFFSFYEAHKDDKVLNLFPVILFAALSAEDGQYEGGDEIVRREKWYIAIEVYSDLENDCLAMDSLSREVVLEYLRALKQEYLSTEDYNEIVFKD